MALGVAAAVAGCGLLVDTDGLSGAAEATSDGGAGNDDAGLPDANGSLESGTDAAVDGDAAVAEDPCADSPVYCETFDRDAPLARYTVDTELSTSITLDEALSVSAPRSAKFVIAPSASGSPDATLEYTTSTVLADYVFEARVHIERAEPGGIARLLYLGGSADLVFEQSGTLRRGGTVIATVDPVPTGRWVALRIEVRFATYGTVTVTYDGVGPGAFNGSRGTTSPAVVRFGVSDARSPDVGWIVRWDNIVIRNP